MKTRNILIRLSATVLVLFFSFMICYYIFCSLFPPTMVWQEFGRTPIADLGLAGKNIPLEKANKVYTYRITLRDVWQFSPGEYLEKYSDDVVINNLIFTQDKDRVPAFMAEKGEKLRIKKTLYHPKALVRR